MKDETYAQIEMEILGMLKSPEFKAHGKWWGQSANIWQFVCYRPIIARSGQKPAEYILQNWNLSKCWRHLASRLKNPQKDTDRLLKKLVEITTLNASEYGQ